MFISNQGVEQLQFIVAIAISVFLVAQVTTKLNFVRQHITRLKFFIKYCIRFLIGFAEFHLNFFSAYKCIMLPIIIISSFVGNIDIV